MARMNGMAYKLAWWPLRSACSVGLSLAASIELASERAIHLRSGDA